MKIRLDFVTNSSSSSFTCVAMYSEELYRFLQKLIAEKKYRKQHSWNTRPQDELHIDCAWEELRFDDRWYKVQTTEEYGKTDKQSVYEYICWFFDGLTSEEKETLRNLISEVYKKKDYQTRKYKDATDGFVGFNFDGPAAKEKSGGRASQSTKQGINNISDEYAGKVFVTTGLEESDEDLVKQTIEKKGGTFKSNFVVGIDCLIVNPDYSHETTKLKKTKELIEKGKDVEIIAFHDFCKKENVNIEDRLPYQNPMYDFYKQREVDINQIDLDGKMIDLFALEHCKNSDAEKNKYYGNYGTAIDVAEAVIANYGGQRGHLGYPDIDYVIVSKQMPIPEELKNNKSSLKDMYRRYCSIEQNRGEAFLEKEEKRKDSDLPEIKIIFEDEFHKWLEKQYDKLMDEGLLHPYGTITITVWIERPVASTSFKSEAFSKIAQQEMESALEKSDSLNELFTRIEAFTKEDAFEKTGKTQLLNFERNNIELYTNIMINYESTDGSKYNISKKIEPTFVDVYSDIDRLKSKDPNSTRGEVKQLLKQGKRVRIICRVQGKAMKRACATLMEALAEKINYLGIVEEGPSEGKNNELSMVIKPR